MYITGPALIPPADLDTRIIDVEQRVGAVHGGLLGLLADELALGGRQEVGLLPRHHARLHRQGGRVWHRLLPLQRGGRQRGLPERRRTISASSEGTRTGGECGGGAGDTEGAAFKGSSEWRATTEEVAVRYWM